MSFWSMVRKVLRVGLPLAGIVIVFLAVLFIEALDRQLLSVAFGIAVIEIGVWGLADPLLPTARRHYALRTEVDRFLQLVRRVQEAAAAGGAETMEGQQAVSDARADLMHAAEQISALASAGRSGSDAGRAAPK